MLDRLREILKGENKVAHKRKNKYAVEMMAIHSQAKLQVISSRKTVKLIESSTAYKIANATGGFKNG